MLALRIDKKTMNSKGVSRRMRTTTVTLTISKASYIILTASAHSLFDLKLSAQNII